MVGGIEEFRSELSIQPLPEFCILDYGSVEVEHTRTGD
jgi:hypothetical protein